MNTNNEEDYVHIESQTPQHRLGALLEKLVFRELKDQGKEVYKPRHWSIPLYGPTGTEKTDIFFLPPKVRQMLGTSKRAKDIRELIESYPWDMVIVENNTIYIIEVKSKRVKYNKDDRKIDISFPQLLFLNLVEKLSEKLKKYSVKSRILVIWYTEEGYYYEILPLTEFKIIGKTKLKLVLPATKEYSPLKKKYKPFPSAVKEEIKKFLF